MSRFDVQTAQLFAAQSAWTDAAAEGRAELARLLAGAQDAFGHGWQSPAAAACGRGFDQWHRGAQGLLAALDEMAAVLGATARTYAAHEAANVERFAS